MSTHQLDQLVQQRYSEHVEHERQSQAMSEQLKQNERHLALTAIDTFLREELEEIYPLLASHWTLSASPDNGGWKVTASFKDDYVTWDISREHPQRQSNAWKLKATSGVVYGPSNIGHSDQVQRGKLRDALLIALGHVRNTMRLKAEKDAAYAAEQETRRQQREAQAETTRLQQEQDRLLALEIDAELNTLVAQQLEAARANAWQWKPGVIAKWYRLRWCTGGARDYELNMQFDYETGYTFTDALDERGYINVYEPCWSDSYDTTETVSPRWRTLKLDMQVHQPVWEELTAAHVDDLPDGLAYTLRLRIDGMGYRDGLLTRQEFDSISPTVARLPVSWLQALIELSAPFADPDAFAAQQEREHHETLDQTADEADAQNYINEHGVEFGGTCPGCGHVDAGCTCDRD